MLKYIKGYLPTQVITHPSLSDFSDYDYRLKSNPIPKSKIAQKITTELIPLLDSNNSKSILLDSGSVTYNIALQMFNYHLTDIVTNNFAIAMLFQEYNHTVANNCRLLPGDMIKSVCAQGGFETSKAAKDELTKGRKGKPSTKISVLGLRAYSPDNGISEDTKELSHFQATLLQHSEKLIIVAQGEKFLKKANAPILRSKDFKYMMDKRKEEKSMYFVYHKPTAELSSIQQSAYKRNLESFLKNIPEDRIFETSDMKLNKNLLVTEEKFM